MVLAGGGHGPVRASGGRLGRGAAAAAGAGPTALPCPAQDAHYALPDTRTDLPLGLQLPILLLDD